AAIALSRSVPTGSAAVTSTLAISTPTATGSARLTVWAGRTSISCEGRAAIAAVVGGDADDAGTPLATTGLAVTISVMGGADGAAGPAA
ncbi:MAG: hypothetical protein KDF64_15130, partial [Geminicoccaceae bacterium]|nr:hypothetical protein [Geminicoccaceae bacterium]